jgi:hypothetical protein
VQTDLGDGIAVKLGYGQAPVTVEESVAGIVEQVCYLAYFLTLSSSFTLSELTVLNRGIRLQSLQGNKLRENSSDTMARPFPGKECILSGARERLTSETDF